MATITITAILSIYFVFFASCLVKKKWCYPFIHPFVFILLQLLSMFYLKTSFAGMERTVDFWTAATTVIITASFWCIYFSLSTNRIRYGLERLFFPCAGGKSFLSDEKKLLSGCCIFVVVYCMIVVCFAYLSSADPDRILFSLYYYGRDPHAVVEETFIPGTLVNTLGRLRMILSSPASVCLAGIIALVYTKGSRFTVFSWHLVAGILAFGVFTAAANTGFRNRLLIALLATYIGLVLWRFVFRQKLSLKILTLLVPLTLFVGALAYTLPTLRYMKTSEMIAAVQAGSLSRSKTSKNKLATEFLYYSLERQTHNQTVYENLQKQAKTAIDEKIMELSEEHVDVAPPSPTSHETTSGPEDTLPEKIDMNPQVKTIVENETKEAHLKYLKAFYPLSIPDYLGWCMAYYGTAKDFMGPGRILFNIFGSFLPKEITGPKPVVYGRQICMDQRNETSPVGTSTYVGPFGEGFIACGYPGGIISSILWGLLLGFMAKCVMTGVQDEPNSGNPSILLMRLIFATAICLPIVSVFRGDAITFVPNLVFSCVTIIVLFYAAFLIEYLVRTIRRQLSAF